MARFTIAPLAPPAPVPGVHIGKIIKAADRVSENGNSMITMTVRFPSGEQLPLVLTFVPRAAPLIGYFCKSAEIGLPAEIGAEVELAAADVLNRYIYVLIEADGDGSPRITRFLSRAAAIAIRPELGRIALQPQVPRTLNACHPKKEEVSHDQFCRTGTAL